MRNDDQKTSLILSVCGILPVVWLALLTAPYVSGGLVEIIRGLPVAMGNPFEIMVCEDSVKTVLIFLLAYAMGIGVYFSTRRNYRRREEHGSAKWGNAGALNKKYRDKDPSANKLLTQNVRIGLDGKKHRRNLNILVCGGSGAGKTRFFCKPNAMQCNTSFVILDPKGEIVRDIGGLLENKGYEVRVLDLINMHRSHCYNPFVYLRNDNDVQRLVTNLFKATTPKGSQSQDPFWDTAASMLLLALVFYLKYEAPPDEQNFPMVMELLRAGEVREDDDSYVSPLDELFDRLEMVNPEHIALKYYRDYHSGSAKTLKSIQITLAARLEKFNLESLAGLTATDELNLPSLGEKKVALFALIPDNDTSFNFIKYYYKEEKSNETQSDTVTIQAKLDKANSRLTNLIAMRADGEISKDEYQAMRSPVDEEIKKLQKALDEIPQEKSNPKGLDIEGIRSTLNSFIDFSGSTISHDVVNQFVYLITPTSDTTFDWYVNLNGTADVKATFTAEGRKKNCIIKLEEIEKISSVHREKNEDNAHFIKNPHIFTYLHRQLSRNSANKKLTLVA